MKFLITGGLGFIGSSVIRNIIQNSNHQVLNLDKQTYAANLYNLKPIELNNRYKFIKGDICDKKLVNEIIFNYKPDYLMHLAAESHVDKSISNPIEFINTNIIGTFNLLKSSYDYWESISNPLKSNFKFHHVSTDEVYGSMKSSITFKEDSRYDPSSPYAASKASSDHLVRAWYKTYKLPIIISNCSNNYGPYQYPEKLIPLTILNALKGEKIPIYGNGLQIRDWLHVEDHVQALIEISKNGVIGETYNIGCNNQVKNIEVVHKICDILDNLHIEKKSVENSFRELITMVKDRSGHDFSYGIDASKINKELNWSSKIDFNDGLKDTVIWYVNNKDHYFKK